MQGLRNMLLEEQERLEKILNQANIQLSEAPQGYLRMSRYRNKNHYYHCVDNENDVYISRNNEELLKKLAEKTYYTSIVKKAESRLKQIRRITRDYSDDEMEELYTSLHEERQKLIVPIEPTWNQIVEEWYAEEHQGKSFKEGMAVILTEKGERVRSKSEKILADYFYRKDVLYKYEKPLHLEGYGTVYPDFTFLSKKLGKEIFWEHEGMMDNPDYARAAVRKIETYQKNGIYLGERLILTFETEQNVLNSQIVADLVEKHLL